MEKDIKHLLKKKEDVFILEHSSQGYSKIAEDKRGHNPQ